MKALTTLTDPVYTEPEKFTRYEKFWLKYINDKRDLPFIHLLTAIHIFVIPAAIILYTPLLQGWYWWLLYIPYFYVSQMYFKGRFGLMLHCISHRKLFAKGYTWLYNYTIWFVCPFFGHTPEYVGRFLVMGFVDTFMYLFSRKRKKLYMRLTYGEISFYLFCVAMSFVNFHATLFIFIIPFVFARIVMMLGNWAQHSFIDKDNTEDNFTSAINCINTKYNEMCWNDGYHTVHHLRPGMHYTEIPGEFLKMKDEFIQKKAIIFDGIHYLHVFVWLMTKNYDKLADNLVNIDNKIFSSKEEAIELMKERIKKIKMTA